MPMAHFSNNAPGPQCLGEDGNHYIWPLYVGKHIGKKCGSTIVTPYQPKSLANLPHGHYTNTWIGAFGTLQLTHPVHLFGNQ